jgi:hypothetical protein
MWIGILSIVFSFGSFSFFVSFYFFVVLHIFCFLTYIDVSISLTLRISSFSLDNTLFATASGDGDSGQAQLLIINPTNGATLYDTTLPGLGPALGSASGVYWIWGVNFIGDSSSVDSPKQVEQLDKKMRFMQ